MPFLVFSQTLPEKINPDDYLKVEWLSDRVLLVGMGDAFYEVVITIVTKKGLVVVDAGRTVSTTKIYRDIIEKETGRSDFIYMINTHGHFDHAGGNQVFPETVIIGHENCADDINRFWADSSLVDRYVYRGVELYEKRLLTSDPDSRMVGYYRFMLYQCQLMVHDMDGNFQVIVPEMTFNDRLSLDLDDITFDLVYFGKAHSNSDIMIHIPQEKLLLIGDLFDIGGKAHFEITQTEASQRWLSVLEDLLQPDVEIERLVYGHGLVFPGSDLNRFYESIQTKLQPSEE